MTRQEKIKLLNNILAGKATIEEVDNSSYSVELWEEDPTNKNYLVGIGDTTKRISKADFEANKEKNRTGYYVTLNLN